MPTDPPTALVIRVLLPVALTPEQYDQLQAMATRAVRRTIGDYIVWQRDGETVYARAVGTEEERHDQP